MSQMTYDQLARAVTELPLSEQRRLLAQISSRLEKNGNAEPNQSDEQAAPIEGNQREALQASIHKSQHWLQANRENYRGEWVVLKGDELIAHGKEELAAVRAAMAQGVKSPFIAFIPEEDLPWAGF